MRDVIRPVDRVVGVLTGHSIRDAELVVDCHRGQLEGLASTCANPPVQAEAALESVLRAMGPLRSGSPRSERPPTDDPRRWTWRRS